VSEQLVLDPKNFACSLISVPNAGQYVKRYAVFGFL